jgi:3-oxoacyl-[acyl-carrier protein] reductase
MGVMEGGMDKRLKGKVAVVTGASKGIGAGIAEWLAEEGASVVVNYASSKAGAERVVKAIKKKGGKAVAVQADVSKEADIKRLFQETKKAFGGLDILVNNAGVYEFAGIEKITREHFNKHFDLNVLGLLLVTKESLKYFGKKGGSVVNVSSVASTMARPESSVYAATKASVDVITKILARELGKRKIRVNAVRPGVVETEGTEALGIMGSEFARKVEEETPLGRLGEPRDVAGAVAFLASDDASWISGATIRIAGGWR